MTDDKLHKRNNEPALKAAGRGTGMVLLIASSIAVIAAVLYFGLGSAIVPGV